MKVTSKNLKKISSKLHLDETMKVSVIIPAQNGRQSLAKLIASIKRQSLRPEQILVVDSSSTDDTMHLCRSLGAEIIQIKARYFDHGGTRNLAASKAKGDILVFMTQDTFFRNDRCLENLIKPLNDTIVAASYGRQMPKKNVSPVEIFARSFNYPSTPTIKGIDDLPRLGIKTFFFSNVCSAVKKSVFEEVGRFPERTIMNEDMFLAAKLIMKGYKIAYQPHAVVYHSHNYSLQTLFQRYFDIGVFFNRNKWIKDAVSSEREGMRYLREEIKYLSSNREKSWIPYALVNTTIRFFGYRTGLLEKNLPLSIKKRISLNKNFWLDGDQST